MKITTFYTSLVSALAELTPGTDDFEARLDELIGLLIRCKYAHHLRETKGDGSTDWATAEYFLRQVEAGMHRNGIIAGWQERAVQP